MTEQLKRLTIETSNPPGIDNETRERLSQVGAEEALEKSSLGLVGEDIEDPKLLLPKIWRRNLWFAGRSLVAAGATIGSILGIGYLASGSWLNPTYRKKREANFTNYWVDYFDDPEKLQNQLEVLFRSHLTEKVDPNNKKQWKGAFGEGARSLVEAIDQKLETSGESWPAFKKELVDKGIPEQYLDLMEELRKESKDGNGDVQNAWNTIGKQGLLRPKNIFMAAYAVDIAKTWQVASKEKGELSRREFLRGFTAPHLREAIKEAIQKTEEK